jgi:inner membrane transporter RhtA
MVTSAASVSFGATIAVKLFHQIGPTGAVTLRLITSALFMVPLLRRGDFAGDRSKIWVVIGFGTIMAAMNLTFYEAISRIPLGIAVTLEFVGPLTVAMVGSRRVVDLLWALMAAAGVVLLGSGVSRHIDVVGVLWALAAGTCWAGYILFSKATGSRFSGPSGLGWALVVAALVELPLGLATAHGSYLRVHVLVMGALIGLLSTAFPYSLELAALRYLTPRYFGIVLSLAPGIAMVMGVLFLSQRPTPLEVFALLLVVLANGANAYFDRSSSPSVVASEGPSH